MPQCDVYCFGMILVSTIHKLEGAYPLPDAYQEIEKTYTLPGGETANSAIVLAKLGVTVKMDGPYLGHDTKSTIYSFAKKHNIDCSGMHVDDSFSGLTDLVIVDEKHRTVFGIFRKFLFGKEKKWSQPDKNAIQTARIISIDPFFGEDSKTAASLCRKYNKPYVTIDCHYDSPIHHFAAATIISGEFRDRDYPDIDPQQLYDHYLQTANGLVIFTFGANDIIFGRKNGKIEHITPYNVAVKGTLGAGDTFRAGIVYGILNHWDDKKTVSFGAAAAASACRTFPVAMHPPSISDIEKVMNIK